MNEDASSQSGRRARREQHTPGALTTSAQGTGDVYTIFVTGELDLAPSIAWHTNFSALKQPLHDRSSSTCPR